MFLVPEDDRGISCVAAITEDDATMIESDIMAKSEALGVGIDAVKPQIRNDTTIVRNALGTCH